ncbi:MAG TPA: hypothetical protein VHI51_19075 [Ktedonobacterales bacterium]|jgi:tetratricopeptide (TPR) repeat protein|nr:hypothetical protein [Ktedonobacterales bacterium]
MRDEPQRPTTQQPVQPAGQPAQRRTARDAARSVTTAKSGAKPKTTKRDARPKPKHTAQHSTRQPGAQPAPLAPWEAADGAASDDVIDLDAGFHDFDPRMLERQMAAMTRLLEQQNFQTKEEVNAFIAQINAQGGQIDAPPATPLEQAQDMVYEASGLRGKKRDALIRQALDLSPDCADAYVLLAESSRSVEQARAYYEQGVQAGERAIGAENFKQLAAEGAFWMDFETRPYMRAREGLAMALWAQGERTAALEHLSALLQLNPNDNQGVRFRLASWLLATGDDLALKRADTLLKQFEEDASAALVYARLLLLLRTKGAGVAADRALETAMKSNPFVPFYLLGVLQPPKQAPDYYGIGDQNEAIVYLQEGGVEAWVARPDNLDWLVSAMMRLAPPELVDLVGEQPDPHHHHRRPRKHK